MEPFVFAVAMHKYLQVCTIADYHRPFLSAMSETYRSMWWLLPDEPTFLQCGPPWRCPAIDDQAASSEARPEHFHGQAAAKELYCTLTDPRSHRLEAFISRSLGPSSSFDEQKGTTRMNCFSVSPATERSLSGRRITADHDSARPPEFLPSQGLKDA